MRTLRIMVEGRGSKVEGGTAAGRALRPSTLDLRRRGFVLIEVMIAVAIFAMSVLALGQGVQACIAAQIAKEDDERARRILENRMAEIELGAVALQDSTTEELKEPWKGMTLRTRRVQLKKKNEKEQEIFGLYQVTLDLSWKSDGQAQSKGLTFHIFPRQR